MPASFLDYLDTPAIQQALAQARVRQQEKALAVQPKPALGPLVEQAETRAAAGQRLALGTQRLALTEGAVALQRRRYALEGQRLDLSADAQAFERRLAPYAIGVGALTAGVGVLGGVRTLRAVDAQAARQATLQSTLNEQLALTREQTAKYVDVLARLRGEYRTAFPASQPVPDLELR